MRLLISLLAFLTITAAQAAPTSTPQWGYDPVDPHAVQYKVGTTWFPMPLLSAANTWAQTQTFTLVPVFTPLTGYIKGNGASAATASATVPFTDLSGQATLAQLPSIAANTILGNATAGSATPTALTALPSTFTGTSGHVLPYLDGVNTWSAQQSFSAPSHGVGTLVANVASLASLSGDASVKVTTLGYSTTGDGGDATYVGQASACSLNAGNGDGGSQIKGLGATCWIAQFPNSRANLLQFGADKTGVADSTTSLVSAVNAMATAKQPLIVPAGTYATSAPAFMNSYSEISCAPGATFKPTKYFSVFATANYNQDIRNDLTPTTSAAQTTTDVSIDGCAFDFSAVTNVLGGQPGDNAAPFSAYLAKRVRFTNNHVIGGTASYNIHWGAKCIGVDYCLIVDNVFENSAVGADNWKGSTNITIKNNKISTVSNPGAIGNIYCVGVNGLGTNVSDQETTSNFTVEGNYCETNGNAGGIEFDALGPGSATKNAVIKDNTIIAKTLTGNIGIYARGDVENVTVSDNTLVGQDLNAILLNGAATSGGPFTCTDCATTTNGSSSVVLALASMTVANVAVGNYVLFGSFTAVGGLSLNGGAYPVIAVNPGVSITINAGANATSSATGGGAISFSIYWPSPSNIVVSGNKVDGATNANAVIVMSGSGHQIYGNVAKGGSYGTFIQADAIVHNLPVAPYPTMFGNSAAVAGTWNTAANIPAGYAGDGLTAYSIYTPPSTMVSDMLAFDKKTFAANALPTCDATAKGKLTYVTDAANTVYNAAVIGGGANLMPVWCDGGGSWKLH